MKLAFSFYYMNVCLTRLNLCVVFHHFFFPILHLVLIKCFFFRFSVSFHSNPSCDLFRFRLRDEDSICHSAEPAFQESFVSLIQIYRNIDHWYRIRGFATSSSFWLIRRIISSNICQLIRHRLLSQIYRLCQTLTYVNIYANRILVLLRHSNGVRA